jgi:hypothetical protein
MVSASIAAKLLLSFQNVASCPSPSCISSPRSRFHVKEILSRDLTTMATSTTLAHRRRSSIDEFPCCYLPSLFYHVAMQKEILLRAVGDVVLRDPQLLIDACPTPRWHFQHIGGAIN